MAEGPPAPSWTPRELQERPPLWGQLQRTWARTPHPARRTEADRPHQHRQQNRQPWHRRREPARIPMAQTARRAEPWERTRARALGARARSGACPWQERRRGCRSAARGFAQVRRLGRGRGRLGRGCRSSRFGHDGLRRRRGRRRYRCCFWLRRAGARGCRGRRGHGLRVRRYRSPCRWRMLLMLRSRRATPSRT